MFCVQSPCVHAGVACGFLLHSYGLMFKILFGDTARWPTQAPENPKMKSPSLRRHPAPAAAVGAMLLVLCGSSAWAQTTASLQLRSLAATCANCHGTEGAAVQGEAMARLAGLPKDYILTQMLAFKEGKRPATVMHQISKGYSNEQIEALASYFAAKK
jgi:cytochrome subunit of sulfide dehydrogenase